MNKFFIRLLPLAILVSAIAVGSAFGAAKKPVAKKPVAKSAVKPAPKPAPRPAIISSTQLKGDQAKFEQEYSLGKDSPINIVVHSAEYSVARVVTSGEMDFPMANEKYLIVKMTLRNPQPSELFIRYDSLKITAITADSVNFDCQNWVLTGGNSLSMTVKPAQKIEAVAYIKVPANENIPKLMFKSSDDLVLRYDLRDKIKPLVAPFADSSDPKGATALATVPGQLGAYCDLGEWDFKLDSAAYTTEPPKETSLNDENNHYLVISGSFKNGGPAEYYFRYDSVAPTVTTADGDDIESRGMMELASRHEWVALNMKKNQEIKVRIYFEMSKDVTPKVFTMKMQDGTRAFSWDLSTMSL